jgi:hypothetical protein
MTKIVMRKGRISPFITTLIYLTPLVAGAFAAGPAAACACGCGVFDVGTASLFATGHGGTAFLEYDYMDQNENWHRTGSAPASANDDKEIRTDFVTAGVEYMFDHKWGVMAEIPYWNRSFRTDDGSSIDTFNHTAVGDIRLRGVYTGFSDDMSTGLEFGVKLPTGDFKYSGFDRDTSIGTGSTDLLLGAYHFGGLTADNSWVWFGQTSWDQPLATQGGYRPGAEVDGAVGVYYNGFDLSDSATLVPMLQLIASHRAHDSGPESNAPNSGYDRMLISPGLELDVSDWKIYGDVEFPIYQNMTGNQLVAPKLFKLVVSHAF